MGRGVAVWRSLKTDVECRQARQHDDSCQERGCQKHPAPPGPGLITGSNPLGTLRLERVLHTASQVAAGPILWCGLKDELRQRSPTCRHAAQGGQDAEQRVCLGSTVSRELAIAKDAQWQVLRLAQLQCADGDLLSRSSQSGVNQCRTSSCLRIRAAQL